jgi:Bacterial mobilisation protein (MobC)
VPASPPPLPDDSRKTLPRTPRGKRVWVRFSDDEHADLMARAKASGLSASALIRDHLGKVEIRHRTDERQRTAMLNHINANLNQIARWVNIHKDAADAYFVMMQLLAVEGEVARLCTLMERRR